MGFLYCLCIFLDRFIRFCLILVILYVLLFGYLIILNRYYDVVKFNFMLFIEFGL